MANGEKGKGRSQNQRLKLFYLLDYLLDYLLEQTDETHTVKVQEIIEHFDNYYKIPVEQKTVCCGSEVGGGIPSLTLEDLLAVGLPSHTSLELERDYLLSFYLFLNVSHLDRPFDGS